MPTRLDLPAILRGDDWEFKFRRRMADGVLFDWTGCAARCHLRTLSDVKIADLNTDNGLIVMGGDSGEITLSLPSDITATLRPAEYLYDLEITYSTGIVGTYLFGGVKVIGDVTR